MLPKALFIWVEDLDASRFCDVVLKPVFRAIYEHVAVQTYAHMKKAEVNKFLRATAGMAADYLFLCDKKDARCITSCKEVLVASYSSLNPNNVVVVVRGIASWYAAGLDSEACKELRLRPLRNTEVLTKEQFDELMPANFDSKIDWMREILENYSIEHAKRTSMSFRYLSRKYKI